MKALYSVYDKKAGIYSDVATYDNDNVAKRSISSIMKGQNLYSSFPGDFELYKLSDFDEKVGFVSGNDKPIFICNLEELK